MKREIRWLLAVLVVIQLIINAQALDFNMAPVIANVPSPIVGGAVTATGSTPFVFADALDLNSYVTDDNISADQIKWSYAITGTPKYAINGVDPMNLSTDDPTTPGVKQINNQVLNGETNADGKANTITIRNINLSPFSDTGATPSGTGIIDSQVVTLFASDGTTCSSKNILFYSDNGGMSRMSHTYIPPRPDVPLTNWTWSDLNGSVGSITSTNTNKGLCMATPTIGGGFGTWSSPFGVLPLTDNSVYRIRAVLNFTQAAGGATCPLWDMVINNYNGYQGKNIFGGDYYFLDNEGGANAIGQASTNFEMWWCPAPIQISAWKSSIFTAANDAVNDALLQFRVMDLDSANGITASRDGGTVCMSGLTLDKVDLGTLAPASTVTTVYDTAKLTPNGVCNAQFTVDPASRADYTSGTVTLTPGHTAGKDGQRTEYGLVTPGDANMDLSHPETVPDNYPVEMEPDTLYMITMNLSAPDASAEANPWDVVWMGVDTPTNEVIAESYVTGSLNHLGMPKAGAPQTYTAFYYSGKTTKSTIPNANRLRWRLAVGNNSALNFTPNTGGLRLHGVTVSKVAVPY